MQGEPDNVLKIFAKVLRERRKELGLTQEELAHRAGVSMRYISLIEGCKHYPTLQTIHGLAKSLDISMGQFLSAVEADEEYHIH